MTRQSCSTRRRASTGPFVDWLGQRLAVGWRPLRGDLSKIAINLAFDAVAMGAQLCGFAVGEDEATVHFTLPDLAGRFGLEEPAALSARLFTQILDAVHVDLDWAQDGEVITFHLCTRATA